MRYEIELIFLIFLFNVSSTGRDGATKEYYTLASLVFLLKNVDLPHSVYAQKAIVSTALL